MKKLSGIQKVVILLLIPTIFLGGYQFYIETASESAIDEVFNITEQALLESNPEISDEELDMALRAKGKNKLADMVKNILPESIECVFVRQREQLGLGHAVLCAERVVGNEPFALLLADDFLTYSGKGIMSDLVKGFENSGKTQLSIMEVNGPEIWCNCSRY